MRTKATIILVIALVLLAGSAVVVAAQTGDADPMAPAVVTGTEHFVSEWSERTSTSKGDGTVIEDVGLAGTWDATDPRLGGEVTYAATYDRSESAGFEVEAFSRVVENDDGRWVGTGTALSMAPDASDQMATDTMLLTGEGAYEGHMAYVIVDSTTDPATFVAGIFPGEMPPPPKQPTSE